MNLKEYLIEAVARRNPGKYMKPDMDSIIKWLNDKGFKEFEYIPNKTKQRHLEYNGNSYMVYRVPEPLRGMANDWISIHTRKTYDTVIWFDNDGSVDTIKERKHEGTPFAMGEEFTLDQVNYRILRELK